MPAEESDLPRLRVVALAGFAGDAPADAAKRGPIPVDKDRFDEALARVAPRLRLELRDPSGKATALELAFEAWRDFQPAVVAARVPWLRGLGEARALVERAGRGELDAAGFRRAAGEWVPDALADELAAKLGAGAGAAGSGGQTAPPPPAGGGRESGGARPSVDSILDMVGDSGDGGGTGDAEARRLVDRLIPKRGERGAPSGGSGGGRAALEVLDAHLARGLRDVLHDPRFRQLEAAWRGLRFVVDRTDFRKPVELGIVPAGPDEAPGALASLADGEDWDVAISDLAFDASARDLERAQALAEAAVNLQTPVVAAVAPAFFGLDSWRALAGSRAPFAVFEEPEYAAWRSFRGDERARWLVLTANRLALRAAYGPDGERARDLAYAEPADAALFGSAAWGVASVLLRAFARTGACVQVSGTRHGLVPDLPLVASADGERPAPTEGVFGDQTREDLERMGLAVLQPYQRDIAFLGALRSFRKPERYPDAEASADAAQHVTLAYQLFASRFVKFVGRTLPELIGAGSADELAGRLRDAVVAFVSTPAHELRPDHVGVGTAQNPDDASLTDVTLRIQPDMVVGGRPVNVLLQFSVRL